jgi:cytoskeletal protein RodZ
MKNIGSLLSAAREEKSYSIEDAARETNIAKRYILALEEEDFPAFPAEAYVVGFLKNYCEFLGLDSKTVLEEYRKLKIQEQGVPMAELLHRPSPVPRLLIGGAITAGAVAILLGAAFFIVNLNKQHADSLPGVRESIPYVLNEGVLEQRLFIGDSINIPTETEDYTITLSALGDMITLTTPSGDKNLDLNQEVQIDVNSDGIAELRISAIDYAHNKPNMGAQLHFELGNPLAPQFEYGGTAAGGGAASNNAAGENAIPAAAAVTSTGSNTQVLWQANNAYPFTLQISFQGYCMMRWEILREAGRQGRNEKYFVRGDEINVQAQNGIRLWLSNAGSVKVEAIGGGHTNTIEVGRAGEVVVADVYWVRTDDGRYNLTFARLES